MARGRRGVVIPSSGDLTGESGNDAAANHVEHELGRTRHSTEATASAKDAGGFDAVQDQNVSLAPTCIRRIGWAEVIRPNVDVPKVALGLL